MHAEASNKFPHAAYIDPTARIYGKVEIGEAASLWPYAVIRAESNCVRIGRYTNLQDHVMVHVGYHAPDHRRRLLLDHASRGAARLHHRRQLPDRHRRHRSWKAW